jgi:predicted neuraminidase
MLPLIPFLSLLGLTLVSPSEILEIKILSSGFIYETAPFPSCQAYTLLETSDGVLTAWIGGTYERHPDVSIYTSHRKNGGWITPALAADGIENEVFRNPTWNPVLHRQNDEKNGRNKLVLLGSNEGISWEELLVLDNGEKGEFSYPAIIQAKEGTLRISYTYNREKIKNVHLSI